MFKNDGIKALWSRTKPCVWSGNYWMVSFALDENEVVAHIISKALTDTSYHSLIRDQHEIVIILHESIWGKYRSQNRHQAEFGPLIGVTLDVPLDIEVSGYLAPMVEQMADKGISIVPQCSLIYDHVFVVAKDISKATAIVKDIQVRASIQ